MKRLVLLAAVAAAVLSGCTSGDGAEPTRTVGTVTSTVTGTRTAPGADFTPVPDTAVAPLAEGQKTPKGERDGRCPYIRAGVNSDPTSQPNVAEIEGNRVGRVTILTKSEPVGCRFYFANPDYYPVADIRPQVFASATAARNAMIRTAEAGSNARTYENFAKGLDGINYRTRFSGSDGATDWAFVFAKGKVLVVVRTEQTDAPLNALYLAEAIATKF